jgi:DNA-directed RNA polymerase specialized sigma24 family protein
VLLLRISEGLAYPDIAKIIGRTESAVRSRVHLAVEQLRRELSRGVDP